MTVQELIDQLQEFEPHLPIFLAQQPSWPFEYSIGRVVQVDLNDDDEDDNVDYDTDQNYAVYIGEGKQLRYLTMPAKLELGW
jgi:hypothetical protein